jgi:hypothetical protein
MVIFTIRERPFNLKVAFSKKIFWFPMLLKKMRRGFVPGFVNYKKKILYIMGIVHNIYCTFYPLSVYMYFICNLAKIIKQLKLPVTRGHTWLVILCHVIDAWRLDIFNLLFTLTIQVADIVCFQNTGVHIRF